MGIKLKLPKLNKKNFPYQLVICYWEDTVSDASWIDIVDIKKAKTLKNIEGVIVGKAIYDGDVKLDELAKQDA